MEEERQGWEVWLWHERQREAFERAEREGREAVQRVEMERAIAELAVAREENLQRHEIEGKLVVGLVWPRGAGASIVIKRL